jgi:hypothetical protein
MTQKNESALHGEPVAGMISNPAEQVPDCVVCGGQTNRQFSKMFKGTSVHYFVCLTCDHVTAGEFDSNSTYEEGSYFEEIDTGWEDRNKTILNFVRWINLLPAIHLSRKIPILDFGCGIARLVMDLNRDGFNAYGFEPFSKDAPLTGRIFNDWNRARRTLERVNLVTCIEVLEHLRDPGAVLSEISKILIPSGYLLISTEAYTTDVHTEDWYYLNPSAGHVSIFSERSLRLLLSRYQFEPILRINGSVWLFRSVSTHCRSVIEIGYFRSSELRVKWRLRHRYRNVVQACSGQRQENKHNTEVIEKSFAEIPNVGRGQEKSNVIK